MDPDIIGLVEVDVGSYRAGRKNQAEELANDLDFYHCHRIKYPDEGLGRKVPILNKQANAVLAREPILRTSFHDSGERLQKPSPSRSSSKASRSSFVHPAPASRAPPPAAELHDLIQTCDKPRVIAGDFNTLSGVWERTCSCARPGSKSANAHHAPTFPSWAPCRELDFICYDPAITPVRFKIPQVRLSDHLPLMFDFEVTGPKKDLAADDGH